jgi:3'(2'), 5'-bisphosphate nucleotidase
MTDLADPARRVQLLEGLVAASLEAGAAIWKVFQEDFDVLVKADASPVTAADTAAEAIILKALASLAPDVPVVAEEEAAAGRIPEVGDRFFLVDPLDGTREFVKRGRDFTVNIGLIENGTPTLGVVYAPALNRLFAGDVTTSAWTADVEPSGVWRSERTPLTVREPGFTLTAVASKSHNTPETEAYLAACKVTDRVSIGSSLKFCLLAAGEADLYPRPSPTSEWDTAAGHAVLAAAGGRVFDIHGAPLAYAKPRFLNPGFVATAAFDPPVLSAYMPREAW